MEEGGDSDDAPNMKAMLLEAVKAGASTGEEAGEFDLEKIQSDNKKAEEKETSSNAKKATAKNGEVSDADADAVAEELGGAEECRSAGRGTQRMQPLGWRRWLVQLRLGPAARGCCTTGRPGEGKIHPWTGGAAATGGTTVLSLSPRWSGGGRRRRMEREREKQLILFCYPHHTRG